MGVGWVSGRGGGATNFANIGESAKIHPTRRGGPGNDHINNKWSRGWVWEVRVGEGGGATKYFAKISESVKIHPTLKCSIKRGPEKEQINI